MKIGINGFGRIGRAIFRVNMETKSFEIPIINEINPDINNIAYTLNYDTTYDSLKDKFTVFSDKLIKNAEYSVTVSQERHIDAVAWSDHGVDIIVDASGNNESLIRAKSVFEKNPSVKKIFITHSSNEVDFTMVLGANETYLNVDNHNIISTSICDATAISPVLKLLLNNFELTSGAITTLHPALNYQNILDGQPNSEKSNSLSFRGMDYSHYTLGRSIFGNLIPKPTTAVDATRKVLVQEKVPPIASFSYRTPTTIVSSADITLFAETELDIDAVRHVFYDYEEKQQYKIIHNSNSPLISLDYKKSDYSAIIDHRWLSVTNGKMLKLVLWYDNEWGYASRVKDQILFVAKQMNI